MLFFSLAGPGCTQTAYQSPQSCFPCRAQPITSNWGLIQQDVSGECAQKVLKSTWMGIWTWYGFSFCASGQVHNLNKALEVVNLLQRQKQFTFHHGSWPISFPHVVKVSVHVACSLPHVATIAKSNHESHTCTSVKSIKTNLKRLLVYYVTLMSLSR